jgi:hypothetical protein
MSSSGNSAGGNIGRRRSRFWSEVCDIQHRLWRALIFSHRKKETVPGPHLSLPNLLVSGLIKRMLANGRMASTHRINARAILRPVQRDYGYLADHNHLSFALNGA